VKISPAKAPPVTVIRLSLTMVAENAGGIQ
jgi:hypothetical protein